MLWKDWFWSWNSNTLAICCEELTHLKWPWCWKKLNVGGEGDDENEMAWWYHQLNGHKFWVNSGSWWWTGRPGVLQSMGSQRIGHNWVTETQKFFLEHSDNQLCLNFFRNASAYSKECRTSPLSQTLVFQMKPNQLHCRFLPIRTSSALQNNTKLF